MSDKEMVRNKKESVTATGKTAPMYRYTPAVDIYETDAALIVKADMPGVSEQELQVEIDQGILTLKGNILTDDRENRGYYRQFKLSERINSEAGEAVLKDGLLTLRLPKSEAAKPKRIAVKTLH